MGQRSVESPGSGFGKHGNMEVPSGTENGSLE